MSKTLYWAVKLDSSSVAKLLSKLPPIHPNVYAHHITLAFRPNEMEEELWSSRHGESVTLTVDKFAFDESGQAVIVGGIDRSRGGIPHVTISCANGVKPVYSNTLLASGELHDLSESLNITGVILRNNGKDWE